MFGRLRNSFNSLKGWIQRYQIAFFNTLVAVILIAVVIFVLLNRSSTLQRQTAEENMISEAGILAHEVQSIYNSYYSLIRATTQIMKNYQNIEIEERRNFINNIMTEILESNRSLVNIYSIWLPNELDGMDDFYANTMGTDETGQFISGYSRERGWIEQDIFGHYRYVLDMDFDPYSLSGIVSEPRALTGRYRNAYVIDIRFPIFENNYLTDSFNVLKGVIGVTVDLEVFQYLVE